MRKPTVIVLVVVGIVGFGAVWFFLLNTPTDDLLFNSSAKSAQLPKMNGLESRRLPDQGTPAPDQPASSRSGAEPTPDDGDQSTEDEPSYEEVFVAEFNRLAANNEWSKLEKYIRESLRNAPNLPEFLPVLLGCLSSVEDRIGYFPVGRGVQMGLYGRQDLKEHAELLADAFMATDSPVLQTSLVDAVASANYYNPNNAHLKRYVEGLLLKRNEATAKLSDESEKLRYNSVLLAAHLRLSGSILESIEFMESLKANDLRNTHVRSFWRTCASQFRAKRYFEGEIEAITRYLIAHTDESIRAKKGSKKEVARLAKIWVTFREQQAYDMAEKHADDATDEVIQGAYDQILAKWLVFEE